MSFTFLYEELLSVDKNNECCFLILRGPLARHELHEFDWS